MVALALALPAREASRAALRDVVTGESGAVESSAPREWRELRAPANPNVRATQPRPGQEITLRYAVVTPEGFDKDRAHPVVVALPPGAMDEAMVEVGLRTYWEGEARRRGFVVVSPCAPRGYSLADDPAGLLVALVRELESTMRVEGGKVHVAGVSNGGRAAFRFATREPTLVASLVVLPGYASPANDAAPIASLAGVPVSMFVGELDRAWVREGERTLEGLRAAGVDATLEVLPGQGHVLTIPGERLFAIMDASRPADAIRVDPATPAANPAAPAVDTALELPAVNRAIEDFHVAFARGDSERARANLAEGAVVLVPDGTRRWTRDELSAGGENAWDAWPRRGGGRRVTIDPSGAVAWFDEVVEHAAWGPCRGSGVLVKIDGVWKISQYQYAYSIPRGASGEALKAIRPAPSARADQPAAEAP